VALADALTAKMMAPLATNNVAAAERPVVVAPGRKIVDREVAEIAKMMVQLASVSAVVVVVLARLLPRRLAPSPPATHTVPPRVTLDLTEMSNGTETVGQYLDQVVFTARPLGI
jgi:hypothetical protein